MNSKLNDLSIPDAYSCQNVMCKSTQHCQDRDSHLLDIMTKLIESSFECVLVSKPPKLNPTKTIKLPNWKKNVQPFKKDSLFWHSIWLSMGKPNKGPVYKVM